MKLSVCFALIAGLTAVSMPARADMVITPSDGFVVVWDGNDGDNFTSDEPAEVPPNLAIAPGAAAFASSELGPELGIDYHFTFNLNDGLYGNANSWISATSDPTPAFAGIRLAEAATITSFAFGRDNGNDITDVNGGQLNDRSLGLYEVQITRTAVPDENTQTTDDPATGWVTIGTIEYFFDDDVTPGGEFTSYFRHEFEVAEDGAGIQATGIRLIVPGAGLAGGIAIDEIEVYGPGVVSPDRDGDGFDNDLETSLGFDPDDAASTPESLADIRTAVEFSFYAAKNRKYRIEASTNLTEWLPVEEDIIGRGAEISRLFSLAGQPARHFRAVRVDP